MHEIESIYVDDDILVINKPSGVLSVADGYKQDMPHLRSLLEPEFGCLWMVHRLDKKSSGVMVLARNAHAHKFLNEQFRERLVKKNYHALVSPCPKWQSQHVEFPLAVNTGRKHLTRVDFVKGKSAYSNFKVLKISSPFCLLECTITTGYRHQIRAHLYHLGIGILGDTLYCPPQNPFPANTFARMMLHASQIDFFHPSKKSIVSFSARTPTIFFDLLEKTIPTNLDTDVSMT